MTRLLLVRHGDTDAANPEAFLGRTDIALSNAGIGQAGCLAECLAGEDIGVVFSSDLQRASRTAGIIAARRRLTVVTDDRLREIDFGDCEGLTYREIERRYPELGRFWTDYDPERRFPGGEGIGDLNRRTAGFLAELPPPGRDETVLVVAHGGSLRLLLCNLLGIDPRHWRQFRLDRASLSIVETYDEAAILCRLNDAWHLRNNTGEGP